MQLNLILYLVLVVIGLGVVTSQHEARELHAEHEKLVVVAAKYKTEFEQLQIEQSTWAMHSRIEEMATKKLQMKVPIPKEVQVIVLDKGVQ
ncbi:MAG: cell division protein FtsL [Methylophilaceae bacterium]|nr:MAG: cell division protein FtsL [Methylophilaceae bacterium]